MSTSCSAPSPRITVTGLWLEAGVARWLIYVTAFFIKEMRLEPLRGLTALSTAARHPPS